MAKQSQIAFDFGELPQPPVPVKKGASKKQKVVIIPQQLLNTAVKKKSTRGRKSLKEMTAGASLVDVPEDEILFQKMYYSIGKVAEMFKVNQSLIRLWENEFDVLKPKKNGKGDRLFRPEDIKNIQLIYLLTREKKYTLEGAKDYFKNHKKAEERFAMIDALKKIKTQYPRLPVIILSSQNNVQVALDVIKAGATEYFTKGNLNIEDLYESINRSCEHKK